MSSSAKAKGSRFEREVAKASGGQRVPLSGAIGGGDVGGGLWETHGLFVECKVRKRLSWTTVRQALVQAISGMGSGGWKYPVAVTKEDNGPAYVTMYLDDYLELLQGAGTSNVYHIRREVETIRKSAKRIDELAQ